MLLETGQARAVDVGVDEAVEVEIEDVEDVVVVEDVVDVE